MLIVSLIIFLVIMFAVMIFLFRRIMTQNVVSATKHLDELSQDYDAKEKKLNKQLEEAKLKSQEILNNAQEEAEKIKMEIIKHAEEEKDNILKQARTQGQDMIEQADKSRKQLLLEIEDRIHKQAIVKACQLIQETLPEEFKKKVHAEWVDDLINNAFSQVERLRAPEDIKEVNVVSAFALTDEQKKKLSKKLNETFSRELILKEELDPKAVAGIIIKIGSLVLDGSLLNKIQEKAR